MKSYFCKNCGRDYKLSECLRNGYSLYCFKCPSTRLNIAGWPLIMVGVSLLALFLVHRTIFSEAVGRQIIFFPAGFGIVLVGFLRLWQAHHQRKKWKILADMKIDDAETEKTAIIRPKTSRQGDPEKWDSNPITNTPDKVKV
jgi:hypothetical protein